MQQQSYKAIIVTVVTFIFSIIYTPTTSFAGLTQVQIKPTYTKEPINSSISPLIQKKIITSPSIRLKREELKVEAVGYCCKDGELSKRKLTQSACEDKSRGTFYRSQSEADQYCGFCCNGNGKTIALDEKKDRGQCLNGRRTKNFYDTQSKADANCGWCALKENVFPVASKLNECISLGGSFHNTKALAVEAVRSEEGFCNLDDERTEQMTEQECRIKHGKFFKIRGMAQVDLIRQKNKFMAKMNNGSTQEPAASQLETTEPRISQIEKTDDSPEPSKGIEKNEMLKKDTVLRHEPLQRKIAMRSALESSSIKKNLQLKKIGKDTPFPKIEKAVKPSPTTQPPEDKEKEKLAKPKESKAKPTTKRIFKSYFEKSNYGRIDWYRGNIYGVGRGYLSKNNKSKAKSLQTAKKAAYENVLQLVSTLRLNDQMHMKTLIKKSRSLNLKKIIHTRLSGQNYVQNPIDPYYEVTLVVQLKGANGLVSKVAPLFQKLNNPLTKQPPPPSTSSRSKQDVNDDEPWLVLDGRNLINRKTIQPALFPKIIDDDGREIYDLHLVNTVALNERGMASYAVSGHSKEDIESGDFIAGRFFRQVISFLSVGEAIASENKSREKRRRYIVKNVKESQGLNHTNLLISADDANELSELDSASDILKDCRVIVVISSPTGGIDGALERYFAYF